MSRIPVGLQLYTVRQEMAQDPVGTIKAVAEMGYEGVEVARLRACRAKSTFRFWMIVV